MIYSDLHNKKVLVTGAGSGIGAATACLLAQQKCFVGVHYFRTADGAEKILKEVQRDSEGCLIHADLRDPEQAADCVRSFVEQAGGLDILINNAGTLIARHSIAEAPVEYYHDVFDTNVGSLWLTTKAALPHLRQSRGNIVNVGSVAAHHGGGAGSGLYAAAKGAVHTLTIAMAKEFAPDIRVNTIVPGLIETRFHEQFSTPERRAKVAKETPLGRNGTAEDVAKAIIFMASDAADFITGEYLAVNGGLHMRA